MLKFIVILLFTMPALAGNPCKRALQRREQTMAQSWELADGQIVVTLMDLDIHEFMNVGDLDNMAKKLQNQNPNSPSVHWVNHLRTLLYSDNPVYVAGADLTFFRFMTRVWGAARKFHGRYADRIIFAH